MVFKINVSHKGRTFKVESSDEKLVEYSIGDSINGAEISEDLEDYELEITGTCDKAGFAGFAGVGGPGLKRILLGYGKGMRRKPKGEGKVNLRPKGLKLRKTVRGKEISLDTIQINAKVLKEGGKKFSSLLEVPSQETKE